MVEGSYCSIQTSDGTYEPLKIKGWAKVSGRNTRTKVVVYQNDKRNKVATHALKSLFCAQSESEDGGDTEDEASK